MGEQRGERETSLGQTKDMKALITSTEPTLPVADVVRSRIYYHERLGFDAG